MKSYTDLEQSKKLAEFLPIESADMCWYLATKGNPKAMFNEGYNEYGDFELPCWSLAALLDIIPYTIYKSDNEFYRLGIDKGYNDYAVWYNNNGFTVNDLDVTSDNFVDACYEMIIKLHELNLL
jgi:hypothetical protein